MTARGNNIGFDTIMNAVVIYEKFDYAVNEVAVLDRITKLGPETVSWRIKPWRLDVLKQSPAGDAALAEAADAHLMVLVVRQIKPLLSWLLPWLDGWAVRRQIQNAGLAVWSGGNADIGSAPAIAELSHFAQQHGLSVLFDESAFIENKFTRKTGGPRGLDFLSTSTAPYCEDRSVCDADQHWSHWGIND